MFFSAAEAACLPNLVSREQLTAAVSAQQASESAMGMVAGPIGGVLLQIGRALPFTFDAVSFLASAVLLTFVRSDFPVHRRHRRRPLLAMFTLSVPCFGVVALSHQLEVTSDHLRSRVGTAFTLLIWAATPSVPQRPAC